MNAKNEDEPALLLAGPLLSVSVSVFLCLYPVYLRSPLSLRCILYP